MAEAENEKDKEEIIEGSGSKKKLLIILSIVLVLLGVSGFFGYKTFFQSAPKVAQEDLAEGTGEEESTTGSAEEKKGEPAKGEKKEGEKPAEGAAHEGEKKEAHGELKAKIGDVFSLAPFQVNLADPYQDRYVQMTVALEYIAENELKEELEKRRAKIRDTIISLTTTKTRKQIMSPEGRMRFRVSLMNTINSFLQRGRIKQLYFTQFIID